MRMSTAKELLQENGIEVNQTTVLKNGRELDALTIGSGDIRPTVYEDSLVNIHNIDEMMQFANAVTERTPVCDIKTVFTKEYFLQHVKSCVRPQMDDNSTLTFSVYGDLEEYFRVYLDGFHDGTVASVVVLKSHIQQLDIDAEELRDAARKNLKASVQILPMSQVLAGFMGSDDFVPDVDELMYVASNKDKMHGASVMLLDDVLCEFCKEHGVDHLNIIGSSIHEVLLIKDNIDPNELNNLIKEVNASTVSEVDQLSDHFYEFYV